MRVPNTAVNDISPRGNSRLVRRQCVGPVCGANAQLCCAKGQMCVIDTNNQAQCSDSIASTQALATLPIPNASSLIVPTTSRAATISSSSGVPVITTSGVISSTGSRLVLPSSPTTVDSARHQSTSSNEPRVGSSPSAHGLSTGAIAGLSIGLVLGSGIIFLALFWFFIRPYKQRKRQETTSQHEIDTTGADAPEVADRGDGGHGIRGKVELDGTEQKSRSATELDSSVINELPTPLPELDGTKRE
jgi:hypothetical protein